MPRTSTTKPYEPSWARLAAKRLELRQRQELEEIQTASPETVAPDLSVHAEEREAAGGGEERVSLRIASTLRFDLDQFQTRAFRMVRPGRRCVFLFGRGCGKTYLDRAIVHTLALAAPDQQIGILYPTLKQARSVIWEGPTGLINDCESLLKAGVVRRLHRGELTAEYANGSRVTTWGAENISAIHGQRFHGLLEDEADDVDPDHERTSVEPTFSRSGSSSIWVKTGTPRRGRHGGLYADFTAVDSQEKGYRPGPDGEPVYAPDAPRRYFGFRLRSSESPQVDQKWLEGVRADLFSKGKAATYMREYDCNFDAAEGLVYPTFSLDAHVRTAPSNAPWTEILVGVDHGWNDPGVILVAGVLGAGRDAVLHVLREVYETQRDTTWWTAKAVEVAGRYGSTRQRWFADPSRPDRISEIETAVRKAYPRLAFAMAPAENDIEPGVDMVSDFLALRARGEPELTPRIVIDPSCVHTTAEFGKYRRKFDPKNKERVLDDIADRDNHAMDCLRYIVFSRFGAPASSIVLPSKSVAPAYRFAGGGRGFG